MQVLRKEDLIRRGLSDPLSHKLKIQILLQWSRKFLVL